MDLDKVFSLIDKAEKSSFNKVEIEIGDVKLCLERGGAAAPSAYAPVREEAGSVQPVSEKKEYNADSVVFAPISGVFYVANEPGAAPFVSEGSKVKKGDTLCIIEAMKTMNEISAPKGGIIERVLKEDSGSVSAGDALFQYAEED